VNKETESGWLAGWWTGDGRSRRVHEQTQQHVEGRHGYRQESLRSAEERRRLSMFIINNYFRGPGRVISRECVCVYVCAENNFLRIRHRTLSTKALCFTLCRSSVRSLVRSDIVTTQGRRNGFEMGAQASLHITLNAPIFRNGGTCPPFPPVSLPMLPLYLMNDLNNFDKTDREYSLAFTDDTVRCWRPRVKVTTGRRGQIL